MNYELKMILSVCMMQKEKSFLPKKNLRKVRWKRTVQLHLLVYRTV